MAIQHYSGELGEFDYDDVQFQVMWAGFADIDNLRYRCVFHKEYDKAAKYIEDSCNIYDRSPEECLRYIGSETDGSKIEIPKGIIVCSYMFYATNIISAPVIPDGVTNCMCMFCDCTFLKTVSILMPSTIVDCNKMFSGCTNLLTVSSIPEKIIDAAFMFAYCESLVSAPDIPMGNLDDVMFANSMFLGCKNLETISSVPLRVVGRSNMFYGCDKLRILDLQQNIEDTLVHYKGKLGEFDYNPCEFRLMRACHNADDGCTCTYDYDDNSAKKARECLRYVGWETDGSKIKIPKGITDCYYMFAGSSLKTPPIIPNGVTDCTAMFLWNTALESPPVIPESVKICSRMFFMCAYLQTSPIIPQTVSDCRQMFSFCYSLSEAPDVPPKACRREMFEECKKLKDYEKQHELDGGTDECPYCNKHD